MDMDTIKAFFDRLFFEMSHEDSLFIIALMVSTFLLGLLFGWWIGRSGKRKLKKALKQKESELITLQAEHKTVQEQLELKEADLTKANLQVEELKTKISQLDLERAQMESNLFEANNQMAILKSENLSNISQIESLNTEIVKLETIATEQADSIDTATSNALTDIDLSQVQNNYDNANLRLAAIEEKLLRMERENLSLKSEMASMKDTETIAFLDEEPAADDEELQVGDVNELDDEGEFLNPEERSALARQKLQAAFGDRIPVASATDKDDLKKINGIGPFIEQKLNDIGIYTFKQIGQFDSDLIQQITDAIQFFPGRIERDDWVGQAKNLT